MGQKVHKCQRWSEWLELVRKGWNSSGVISCLLHVGPSGDRFGGQAFMEHYSG
jgi:hypothetical protein